MDADEEKEKLLVKRELDYYTEDESRFHRYLLAKRWHLSYLVFLGVFFLYSLRVNLSVAVVCMVNGTSSHTDNTSNSNSNGDFTWDESTKSNLLSSYFYGYIVLQIPGGWVAGKFGGSRVITFSMLFSSILTLVLPWCARTSLVLLYASRILVGLFAGVVYPALQSMWGRWAPPKERTMLAGFAYSGGYLGTIVSFAMSGYLCDHGFAGGWPSIFYLTGGFALAWTILWFLFIHDTPATHPSISVDERDYIVWSLGERSEKAPPTPWRGIMTSSPFWALIVAIVAVAWVDYTFLTSLPQYMKDVLDYDITQDGILSSVPSICQFFSSLTCGHVADWLRRRGWSTRLVRNIFQTLTFLGIGACLAGVGSIDKQHRNWAVVLLGLSGFFAGFQQAGYVANFIDIAPRFAGVLYGIGNCVATLSGILSPHIVGALTTNKTRAEWSTIFFLCVGVCLVAEVVFVVFSRGHVQEWALDKEDTSSPIPVSRNVIPRSSDRHLQSDWSSDEDTPDKANHHQ